MPDMCRDFSRFIYPSGRKPSPAALKYQSPEDYMNEEQLDSLAPEIPMQLPLFLTNDLIIFPGVLSPIIDQENDATQLFKEVLTTENKLLTVALKKPGKEPGERVEEPYPIGCVALVLKMARVPDGSIRLLLQGLGRVKIKNIEQSPTGVKVVSMAHVKPVRAKGIRVEALARNLKEEFSEIIDKAQQLPAEMKVALININDPGALADFITSNLNIKPDERQEILSAVDVEERLAKVSKLVTKELQIIRLGSQIQSEVSATIEKNQREYFLREQLKAIRRELGEDQENTDITELMERLDELDAPEKVKETAEKEIERLKRMNPAAADYNVSRNYIDWILDLPWNESSEDRIEIAIAKRILNRDHYGLNDVKERILEYLAVRKLKPEGRGSILCFVGPPGVGKTSIGKSIASAMGRKFVRMSLGGMRDEAEIRGHRRTYIGALPGRIIQN
ncbi:MAG TPA: AAA family ATPase, partial [Bacteroidetes bacterium]|nr:AAA family ATPase [Bacteroidota bacterium]